MATPVAAGLARNRAESRPAHPRRAALDAARRVPAAVRERHPSPPRPFRHTVPAGHRLRDPLQSGCGAAGRRPGGSALRVGRAEPPGGRAHTIAPVLAIGGNHDRQIGMDAVREAVARGGGQWIHDRVGARDPSGRVIAVSGPETPPNDEGHVRVLCAHNPRIWKTSRHAGYDLVLAGHLHGCQLVAWHYRDRLFPGAIFYPYCFLSRRFGSTRLVVSRGVSDLRGDSLAVSARSRAVPCLNTGARHGLHPRATDHCASAWSCSDAFCAVCRASSARHRRRRCGSWASSRSIRCVCFARRSRCRERASANWPWSWTFWDAQMRPGITRICAATEYEATRERLAQGRPWRAHRRISQPASRAGRPAPADRRRSSTFRRSAFVPRGGRAAVVWRQPLRLRWTPRASTRRSGRRRARP